MTAAEIEELRGRISCPVLLVYGSESWASNPQDDGRITHFRNARVVTFDNAGHWVHHDRLDAFLDLVREFIGTVD
jgi:pimeloyl-ACP methyl ester carboxylesterase